MLTLLLAITFVTKAVDLTHDCSSQPQENHSCVTVQAVFPVRLSLEPMGPEVTEKGEALTECKLFRVKIDSPDGNPFQLECKGKRRYKIKAISFSEDAK
jgi:hypothetical protein